MKFHDSFGDFVIFLCIHVAYADDLLHPEEERVIIEKLTQLFPLEGNPKKKFDLALSDYQQRDKATINEFVHYSFRHFKNIPFAQRYKTFMEMYDIIHADGKVDESEKKALHALKQIIDLGAY